MIKSGVMKEEEGWREREKPKKITDGDLGGGSYTFSLFASTIYVHRTYICAKLSK